MRSVHPLATPSLLLALLVGVMSNGGCTVTTPGPAAAPAPAPAPQPVAATPAPAPEPAPVAVTAAPAPAPAPIPVTATRSDIESEPTPGAPISDGDDDVDSDDVAPAAVSTFHPVLEPYGQWVDDDNGLVWVPNPSVVGADFSPYMSNGHWSYTDEGYYWVSDFNWGWATFHYGRWGWSDNYGWTWAPGAEYSPAWVEWRSGGGYMGWRPAQPTYYWRNGAYVRPVRQPVAPVYSFTPSGDFFSPHPATVVVPVERSRVIVESTTPYPRPMHRAAGAPMVFRGPPPAAAGIPHDHLVRATFVPPTATRPEKIVWKPAPGPSGVKMSPRLPPGRKMTPVGRAPIAGKPEPRAEAFHRTDPKGSPAHPAPGHTTPPPAGHTAPADHREERPTATPAHHEEHPIETAPRRGEEHPTPAPARPEEHHETAHPTPIPPAHTEEHHEAVHAAPTPIAHPEEEHREPHPTPAPTASSKPEEHMTPAPTTGPHPTPAPAPATSSSTKTPPKKSPPPPVR